LYFGYNPVSGYPYYVNGKLDDIGIWNRALTQQEITNLYNAGPFDVSATTTTVCAGQPTTLSVQSVSGTITALNCTSATNSGTLVAGTAAGGVSASVPYTGGNGGAHNGQTVTSTGVTGLTATLTSGTFASGNGSLTYNITGTPSASGTASFALNIGGKSCTLSHSVGASIASQYSAGSVFCASGPTAIVDVTNPLTGRTWMDRNLGAIQVASNVTDANSYGDLYQWGRRNDGHQCRNSATNATLSSSAQPSHGEFIVSTTNWLITSNNNLWQVSSGSNNPCPSGYRVPTNSEMSNEVSSWNPSNPSGSFSSPLKLPYGGFRYNSSGFLGNPDSYIGQNGFYWTGTTSGTDSSRYMVFINSSGNLYSSNLRAAGLSVRCIKELIGTIGAINCGAATTTGTLYANTPANGVSISVPYTGGNSGTHNGQTVTSMGISGLTATLVPWNFNNGAGSLIYNITGTVYSTGMVYFLLNIGGKSCTLSLNVEVNVSNASCGATNVHNPSLTYGTVVDQEGNSYKTIVIGSQEWMAENLKTSTYSNGDQIHNVIDQNEWSNVTTGAWVHYNNDSQYECPYGKLYNWYAAADPRNICPTGWHVPSDAEWSSLINYLDPNADGGNNPNTAGGKMKSNGAQYWQSPNTDATNESGFSGLPGGIRKDSGLFYNIGDFGYFWSSTEFDTDAAWYLEMDYNIGDTYRVTRHKGDGFSIRCLRD
jgi:uncharacterized protein (TIGR02145 family)